MQSFLQDLIMSNLFAFMMIFTRVGSIIFIMPGISDSYVPNNVRMMFTLTISFILLPLLAPNIPPMPSSDGVLFALIISEAMTGIFIGLVMRLMLAALNVAGSVASLQSGLSNAMMFNPASGAQGTVIEAFYTITGLTLIFITDMHHYMLTSMVYSYQVFPVKEGFPDAKTVMECIVGIVNSLFAVGVKVALPFVVVITLMNIGMGLLGKLMPQLQIFFLAMPLQVFLSFVILLVTFSYAILYWLDQYSAIITKTLSM